MKISDVTKTYGIYGKQPAAGRAVQKPAAAAKLDRLMLSRDAIDFQSVMKGLKEAPDIRADKVAEAAARYKSGVRHAEARDIAEALLKSGGMPRLR